MKCQTLRLLYYVLLASIGFSKSASNRHVKLSTKRDVHPDRERRMAGDVKMSELSLRGEWESKLRGMFGLTVSRVLAGVMDSVVTGTKMLTAENNHVKTSDHQVVNDGDKLKQNFQTLTNNLQRDLNLTTKEIEKVRNDYHTFCKNTGNCSLNGTSFTNTTETRSHVANNDIRTRLLIGPWGLSASQLELASNVVTPYSYLVGDKITALAYDPTRNSVIVSGYKQAGINSYPLDGGEKTVLQQGVISYGIAVDEAREIVFVSTFRPSETLSRMNTQGGDYRIVVDFSTDQYGDRAPANIALDTQNQVVYMCKYDRLLSLTYDGRDISTLHTMTRRTVYVQGVAHNNMLGLLYFSEGPEIWSYALSGGHRTKIGRVGDDIWSLLLYDDVLYTSSANNGNINAYMLRNDTAVRIGRTGENAIVCMIP